MEQANWLDFKVDLRGRLRNFSLEILEMSESLPNTSRGRAINHQITRSGTSVYANYRAALRARSKKEFFAKLSIVVEEADETEMWLELIIASEINQTDFVKKLHQESLELVKILASMRKRLYN